MLCASLASKARDRTVIPAADTAASSPVTIDFSVRVGRWQRPELDPASGPAALAIRLGVDLPLRLDRRARS
jgi:hypothetical protein